MKASELTFGLKLERDAPLWWGARALFERQSRYRRELLGDGQSWAGGSQAHREALSAAINKSLPGLRAVRARQGQDLYEAPWERVVLVAIRPVTFHVSCRRSFGYLYIAATWATPPVLAEAAP